MKSLQDRALRQGLNTPGEYIKSQILKSLNNHSVITIKPTSLPIYNPALHPPGTHVLIPKGKRLIPAIVPELDAEGNSIPN